MPGASPLGAADKPPAPLDAEGWHWHVPSGQVAVLLSLLAGVVVSDVLKGRALCPSLSYWLAATAMIPVTVATMLAVRWALPPVPLLP
jgi:hypothetical protein